MRKMFRAARSPCCIATGAQLLDTADNLLTEAEPAAPRHIQCNLLVEHGQVLLALPGIENAVAKTGSPGSFKHFADEQALELNGRLCQGGRRLLLGAGA